MDVWLRSLAIIEREWKENNKYGPKVEKKARELLNNKPIGMTECFLSSSKYILKCSHAKKH